MPPAEVINDEYGRRILFTVISKNPLGSEICKKPLRVEEIKRIFSAIKILFILTL
jgi:hypothetical protein